MRFQNPIPRQKEELCCYLLIALLLPMGFIYDVLLVWPTVHSPSTDAYTYLLIMGIFLLFNVEANLLACMLIDTSVDSSRLKAPPEGTLERTDWRHCTICDRLAPPRSWHCKSCGVCILKRGHHCTFSGCCIGHANQRYFMCFLLHLVVESIIMIIHSSIYIWRNGSSYLNLFIFNFSHISQPFSDFDIKLQLLFYSIHIAALILAIKTLLVYVPSSLQGAVLIERGKRADPKHNKGLLANLRSVFGQRLYLVWLSPLIRSDLPESGYT